jgi:hypothetical protein
MKVKVRDEKVCERERKKRGRNDKRERVKDETE